MENSFVIFLFVALVDMMPFLLFDSIPVHLDFHRHKYISSKHQFCRREAKRSVIRHGPVLGVTILKSKLKMIRPYEFHCRTNYFCTVLLYNLHKLLYSMQQKHMKNEQTNTIIDRDLTMGGQQNNT